MNPSTIIGIDLGGTNVRAGLVGEDGIVRLERRTVRADGAEEEVLQQLYEVVEALTPGPVAGIGIGVPGLVDTSAGIVYDLINIPSWREVPLRALFEARFGVPVHINNDANCFALAERHFGAGRAHDTFVGLIVGTGMAGGIIIDGELYEGRNCGAGEFGMIRYRDHYLEYYCSGQFFEHFYGITGREAARRAEAGEAAAREMWQAFGRHLGYGIEAILYAYDPELIVLGGSVGRRYPLYRTWLWESLRETPYQHSVANLRLEVSALEEAGVLGAAALVRQARGR